MKSKRLSCWAFVISYHIISFLTIYPRLGAFFLDLHLHALAHLSYCMFSHRSSHNEGNFSASTPHISYPRIPGSLICGVCGCGKPDAQCACGPVLCAREVKAYVRACEDDCVWSLIWFGESLDWDWGNFGLRKGRDWWGYKGSKVSDSP